MVALTGAGVSAASGIPTYRNDAGEWQRAEPILHQAFIAERSSRQRYWARSMAGWSFVARSTPNAAHHALAVLEKLGHVSLLVTQNVDRLHQRAGHQQVLDLHGRIDRVVCLDCDTRIDRASMQMELARLNPGFEARAAGIRPDGDAEIADGQAEDLQVPECHRCAGTLKPDVVFFGGTVPRHRVEQVNDNIRKADALLVAGSSLAVYSGFRFCRLAAELQKPIIIINRGRTRADGLATLKVEQDCAATLGQLASSLETRPARNAVT